MVSSSDPPPTTQSFFLQSLFPKAITAVRSWWTPAEGCTYGREVNGAGTVQVGVAGVRTVQMGVIGVRTIQLGVTGVSNSTGGST